MENQRTTRYILTISALSLISSFSFNTFAANTQLWINNASGEGNAYAATAAVTDDVSVQYYNPAGLTFFPQKEIVFGGVTGFQKKVFTGTTTFKPLNIQQVGSTSANILGEIPFFYYARPILDRRAAFGWGFSAFGGSGQVFPDNSILRYTSTKSLLSIGNTGPSVAFKTTENLSLGVGLDINFALAILHSMAPGFPGTPDSKLVNSAMDYAYGFHAGLLYQLTPATRVGLAYRSRSNLQPAGTSIYQINPYAPLITQFSTTKFNFNLSTAPTTTLSIYHYVTDRFIVMGGFDYSQWGILHSVTLNNVAFPTGPVSITNQLNYRNTWRFSGAVNFIASDKLLLRTGVYYDQDPSDPQLVPADQVPSPIIINLGIGARYQINKTTSVDLGYTHGFVQNVNIYFDTPIVSQLGTYRTSGSNGAGIQFNFKLDNCAPVAPMK